MRGPDGVPTRHSPVDFGLPPAESEVRNGWSVVLRYKTEESGTGPWLVDLSHRQRWDFQDAQVAGCTPLGLSVPRGFGEVSVRDGLVIARMNRTQVSIWHLGPTTLGLSRSPGWHDPPLPGQDRNDTTDAHCMLAFVGEGSERVLEYLTALDLFLPSRPRPFLTQGPVLGVPCQAITFADNLVVMTFSRGFAETFVRAALDSGGLAGLEPGGEDRFREVFAARPRVLAED